MFSGCPLLYRVNFVITKHYRRKEITMNKIDTVAAYDGYPLKVKYTYPENGQVDKIVIYVNGSGPSTYDNKRKWIDGTFFNYHDFFADEFLKRNIAYCTYNTRGVEIGDTAPFFVTIDDEAYLKYLPSNSVRDVEAIINHLLKIGAFAHSKVYLLGWSEGTIIAPLVALNGNVKVDALLLAGYANENLKDIMTWQFSGNLELTIWKKVFDYDRKGYITKEDFEADKNHVREKLFGNKSFEDLDKNGDGKIDAEDAALRSLPHLHNILKAVENNDDEWLKNNHGVRLTSGWLKEHFALKPNKEILPLLELPIFIFQGEFDAMCPKQYAEDIKSKFDALGKTNLTVTIFQNHDHDLNYALFLFKKEISQGIASILETAERL